MAAGEGFLRVNGPFYLAFHSVSGVPEFRANVIRQWHGILAFIDNVRSIVIILRAEPLQFTVEHVKQLKRREIKSHGNGHLLQ